MYSLSYGCFSTGMHDDCVKALIERQEGPLAYSMPCSALLQL